MSEAEHQCPRCGYDQSGAIAMFPADRCPIEGLCTECGLTFRWRDVFVPRFHSRRWFFEHARRLLIVAYVITLVRSVAGWSLWRWISMEHPGSRARRIAFVVSSWLITGAAAYAWLFVSEKALVWVERRFSPVGMARPFEFTVHFRWMVSCPDHSEALKRVVSPWSAMGLGAMVVMPIAFGLLPQTLRRARVKRAHVWKIFLYHTVTLPLVPAFVALAAMAVAVCVFIDCKLKPVKPVLGELGPRMLRNQTAVGIACVAVWLYQWWASAVRLYLRLPHARSVALAMTMIAMGAAVGVTALIPGGLKWLVW